MNKTVKFLRGDRQLYQRFKIRQVIGTGNSIVYQVCDQQNTIQCVKQIRFDQKQKQFIFLKQTQLLTKIKTNPHPNLVQYRGSYILQEQKGTINTIKKGYIQMEKGVTDLKTFLSHRKKLFDQEDIIVFVGSMIEVFAHLQKSQIAHRDIKPSNILLFSEDPLYFKVCDVGAGTAVNFCDYTKEMTVIGTPYYLSPQLFRAYRQKMHLVNYKAFKSDTYSLGLLFLQFCTLNKIEQRLNKQNQRVEAAIKSIKESYPNIIGLGKILRKMLEQDIAARMDFIQLQRYITQNNLLRNKINKTVNLDPLMYQQMSSNSLILIDKLQDLSQIQAIVSTDNKFSRLNIAIKPAIGGNQNQKELFQQLANIKHMKLKEMKLSLEMCNLNDRHATMLAQAIQKNKAIQILTLDLWNNQITQAGMGLIVKAIQNHLPQLNTLELNFASNHIKISQKHQKLFNFSNVMLLQTFKLNLGFNFIQPNALIAILGNISTAHSLHTLVLDLQNIRIHQTHLAMALKQLSLPKISTFEVNLSCNSMRDQGMYALGDLCANMPGLNSLKVILRNSQITDKGFLQFLKTISSLQNLLQLKLNLMNNQITQKGMKMGSLLQTHTKLQFIDLNLSNNSLSDFAFKFLCNSVSLLKQINKIRLVFDTCSLTQKGCLYLGRLISQVSKLEQIDISIRQNDVKLDGVQYICAGLIQIKRIKKLRLNLQGTNIGDYAANYLAACLLKLRQLTYVDLNLQCCDLSSQTMQNIVKTVHECCRQAGEISIDMRRNRMIKKELLEELRREMEGQKVWIRVDSVAQESSGFITA